MKKEHILKKNFDFQRIIKNNPPYKYKDYILYIERNSIKNYYFGFSVGKKIGNAVIRNKVKRQLRSIVSKKAYQNGFNCIIIVGSNILKRNYLEMEQNLIEVLQKTKLIKGEKNE